MSIEPITASETTAPARRTGRRSNAALGFTPASLDALQKKLLGELQRHHPGADLEPVERAFRFAVECHQGQQRASGGPYVLHPITTALLLAELGLDLVAIQAALLHDVPEDTDYSLRDLEELFG